MTSNPPSISIDRSVGQLWSSVEVDTDRLVEFYDGLPMEDKPPLEECHIHFSGLSYSQGATHTYGMHLRDPERANPVDTTAPPSNIVVFMGSFFKGGTLDPDHILGHELTHYAEKAKIAEYQESDREIELRARLALQRGCFAKAGFLATTAIVSGFIWATDQLPGGEDASVAKCVATATVINSVFKLATWKRRSKKRRKLQKELYDIYLEKEHEVSANEHADLTGAVILGDRLQDDSKKVPIFMADVSSLERKLMRLSHRLTALGSRS